MMFVFLNTGSKFMTLPGYSTYTEAKNYLHQSCSHYLLQGVARGRVGCLPPLPARAGGCPGVEKLGRAEKGSIRGWWSVGGGCIKS